MDPTIYADFNRQLVSCLKNKVSEDGVRYSFFNSVVAVGGLTPSQISLEYPHNAVKGAKIDTYIPHFKGYEVVVEFKYDRAIPSGKNSPRPQKAGKLFNDMRRLLEFKVQGNAIRLFVYLTDDEMADYMRNARNGLAEFFGLAYGQSLAVTPTFFNNKSQTFQKSCGSCFDAKVTCVFTNSLPMGHELRVFELVCSPVATHPRA